jgi:hypothetical protein
MTRVNGLLCIVLWLPLAAGAAEDGRVNFLEQEVRRLQQEVLAMRRRLDALERPALNTPGLPPRADRSVPASDTWLDAAKWKKLRVGMSELELLSLLGTPTSMREMDGARVMFYAREIGGSAFLGGSVTLRDGVVSEVQPPVLR